jgi:hypothetical protein
MTNAKDFAAEKERYLRKKNEKIVTAYKLALVMLGMSKNKAKSKKLSAQKEAITITDGNSNTGKIPYPNKNEDKNRAQILGSKNLDIGVKNTLERGRVINNLLQKRVNLLSKAPNPNFYA